MTTGLFFFIQLPNMGMWKIPNRIIKRFRNNKICCLPSLNLVTMIVAGKAIRTKAINTATEPHIYKEDREIIER